MLKVKITVKKVTSYPDLIKQYENPIKHTCEMKEGDTFLSIDVKKPKGFCESAWSTIFPFVSALARGEKDFYDGWMKNERSAMISCNDGFRPVSFLLEVVEE